ncbi:hypothetical protein QTJ16_000527 [Diplocarpon rosae]|uniref:Galactosyl transferase GMA12/MNN10 family protein n=1 Tax=Diplocarpon rosae TaxID=946125 RepID=A0AAD9T6G6_9HELO|nr:hypothetical protein QTJ16_000527 [Diplocarpon rosae]
MSFINDRKYPQFALPYHNRQRLHPSKVLIISLFWAFVTYGVYFNKFRSESPGFGSRQAMISDSDLLFERKMNGQKTISKVSMLYGNQKPGFERAMKTHEEHNRLHGYRMHLLRHEILDNVWSKPAYILSILLQELTKPETERVSWLFWFDADTVLLNRQIPLEIFIPPAEHGDVQLLKTDDFNGFNNGVFMVAVTSWSVELFTSIISFQDFSPDTPLFLRDQSAMNILLMQPKYANHTVTVPQHWFNAYKEETNPELAAPADQVRSGDLLVHLAGLVYQEEWLDIFCNRWERDPSKWDIDLDKTTYPAEIKEFWRNVVRH